MLLKKREAKTFDILLNNKEVFLKNEKQKYGLKQYKNLPENE